MIAALVFLLAAVIGCYVWLGLLNTDSGDLKRVNRHQSMQIGALQGTISSLQAAVLASANDSSVANCSQTHLLFAGDRANGLACAPNMDSPEPMVTGVNVTFTRISRGIAVAQLPAMGCYGGGDSSGLSTEWPEAWAYEQLAESGVYTECPSCGGETHSMVWQGDTPPDSPFLRGLDSFEASSAAQAEDWGIGNTVHDESWAERVQFQTKVFVFALSNPDADPCDTAVPAYTPGTFSTTPSP